MFDSGDDESDAYQRIVDEKVAVVSFLSGEAGVYNLYSFLCEILRYHKAKYPGEKVDDEVLGAFLKEFSLNNERLSN